MRKIAIITGTRAEYGLLYWIIKGIHEDPRLKLQLIVACMHLSRKFGMTVNSIVEDGFPISAKVKMLKSSNSEDAIANYMGQGMIGFAKAYKSLKPDILVVLGDRFEILSAVAAALPFRIPVVHIHGGEITQGLIDEGIRHAVTKMSHIHFASTEIYRKRLIQMGEDPKNVFCCGAPGLDNIYKLKLMGKKELIKQLGIPDKKIGVITYHPVTLEKNTAKAQISAISQVLKSFPGIFWIFTMPNADTNSLIIVKAVNDFVKANPDMGKIFISLGQHKYLSLLKNAAVMVGNSSSGIIEAPSFKLPTVNIGDRQKGRLRAANVIDVTAYKKEAIISAIRRALSIEFKKSLKNVNNPYDSKGRASEKIIDKLRTIDLGEDLIKKKFHDIL